MKKLVLRDHKGQLTAYAFACGYVETYGAFTLSMEHHVYHVKGFGADGIRRWESAETLTKARKLMRAMDRKYGR